MSELLAINGKITTRSPPLAMGQKVKLAIGQSRPGVASQEIGAVIEIEPSPIAIGPCARVRVAFDNYETALEIPAAFVPA